jgi:hypothetical protein
MRMRLLARGSTAVILGCVMGAIPLPVKKCAKSKEETA